MKLGYFFVLFIFSYLKVCFVFLGAGGQNHREVDKIAKGVSAAVRIDDANGGSTLTYGRQFSADSGNLYSSITRETINALKAHFKDQVRSRKSFPFYDNALVLCTSSISVLRVASALLSTNSLIQRTP